MNARHVRNIIAAGCWAVITGTLYAQANLTTTSARVLFCALASLGLVVLAITVPGALSDWTRSRKAADA